MKKIVLTLVAMTCLSQAAFADEGRWHSQRWETGRHDMHEREFHSGGYRHNGWGWVPWVSAAAIGSTLYLANQYNVPPPPATVYVTPPVVTDPARVAYFCQINQQYYPNTPTCSVPWQIVPY